MSTIISAVGPVYRGASGALLPNVNAYHAAFLFSAALALIGALVSLTIHDSDAAATMKKRTGSVTSNEQEHKPEHVAHVEI